jgi:hypothetical protein
MSGRVQPRRPNSHKSRARSRNRLCDVAIDQHDRAADARTVQHADRRPWPSTAANAASTDRADHPGNRTAADAADHPGNRTAADTDARAADAQHAADARQDTGSLA